MDRALNSTNNRDCPFSLASTGLMNDKRYCLRQLNGVGSLLQEVALPSLAQELYVQGWQPEGKDHEALSQDHLLLSAATLRVSFDWPQFANRNEGR